jgi:hypothetical protein
MVWSCHYLFVVSFYVLQLLAGFFWVVKLISWCFPMALFFVVDMTRGRMGFLCVGKTYNCYYYALLTIHVTLDELRNFWRLSRLFLVSTLLTFRFYRITTYLRTEFLKNKKMCTNTWKREEAQSYINLHKYDHSPPPLLHSSSPSYSSLHPQKALLGVPLPIGLRTSFASSYVPTRSRGTSGYWLCIHLCRYWKSRKVDDNFSD